MIVLRDPGDVAGVAHPFIRELAALRYTQILAGEPYDYSQHGEMVVVEAGDTVEQLEAAIGLPLLHGLFDDLPYGHPDFAPCFEILEEHTDERCTDEHGTFYEMVFISNDDGAATTVFIPDAEDIPGDLLAMCRSFATPAMTLP